jgi:phosphatidylglycerophosphatase A
MLWIAQGFGAGRIPFAPGTWGSLLGFLWIWALLLPGNIWFYLGGIAAGFFIAVWVGHRAEIILEEVDPGSIVIDEIAAMPLAFLGAFLIRFPETPSLGSFMDGGKWCLPLAAFVLFRIFDIIKPLGINRSQKLPGGWGLVIDDFLAAALALPIVGLIEFLL